MVTVVRIKGGSLCSGFEKEMQKPRRLSLSLTHSELDALRLATDLLLNVPAAEATEQTFGREPALKALRGRRVLCKALAHDAGRSVAKAMTISDVLPPKQKRRSGRSNWPSSASERQRIRARTLERRAAGLPPPPLLANKTTDAPPMEALLSPEQREAVSKVASQVALSLGVPIDSVSPPDATVQMLATDSIWWHEQRGGVRVEVALHDGTKPPEFQSSARGSMPLAASEAIAFDQRIKCRRPKGDWRRALVMTVRM